MTANTQNNMWSVLKQKDGFFLFLFCFAFSSEDTHRGKRLLITFGHRHVRSRGLELPQPFSSHEES